jgi:FHA domain
MRFEISYRGGSTHEVEPAGNVVVLGRDSACDIVLNDAKCSRRHAVVEKGPDGLVVRDSGSANGVYVNGRRVERARLRPGDVIRLGDAQLKLLHELGETVVLAPDDLDAGPMAGEAPAPGPPCVEHPVALPSQAAESPRAAAALAGGPRRPTTVSLLVALWALFVPASVAACLLAVQRLGGGPILWTAGSLTSLVLAGLGASMALGLRALASWARHLQIGTAAVGLLVCPFTLASATVLLYMTRPEVKAAFEGQARGPAGTGDGAAEATFALSLVGMLVLGLALTAIAVLVL